MSKWKLFLMLVLCVLSLCVLVACTTDAPSDAGKATDAQTTASATGDVDDNQEMPILLQQISEDDIENFNDPIRFTDPTAQNTEWHLVFKTTTAVRDFQFIAIDAADAPKLDTVLHTIEKLTPEKPLLVSTYILDASVNRGISFVDASGTTRYYAICYSGKDGALSLEPITLADTAS